MHVQAYMWTVAFWDMNVHFVHVHGLHILYMYCIAFYTTDMYMYAVWIMVDIPFPPPSKNTRSLINSPVLISHNLTLPSSLLVTTKCSVNWRLVTALWCLLRPCSVCKQYPLVTSQTYNIEYINSNIPNLQCRVYTCK